MFSTFKCHLVLRLLLLMMSKNCWRHTAAVMVSDRKRESPVSHAPRRGVLERKCHEQCFVRDFSKPIIARHLCSRASIQSTREQAPCHFSRWVLMLKAKEPCTVYISIMSVETWSPSWNRVRSFWSLYQTRDCTIQKAALHRIGFQEKYAFIKGRTYFVWQVKSQRKEAEQCLKKFPKLFYFYWKSIKKAEGREHFH